MYVAFLQKLKFAFLKKVARLVKWISAHVHEINVVEVGWLVGCARLCFFLQGHH